MKVKEGDFILEFRNFNLGDNKIEAKATDDDGAEGSAIKTITIEESDTEQKTQQGFNMFKTQSGTMFAGANFKGVPLGNFDFGGANTGSTSGAPTLRVSNVNQDTGTTDLIIKRLSEAVVPNTPGSATIPIELVALQLVSVEPIDLGSGLDLHFITLQSVRGGPASSGMMEIRFDDADGFFLSYKTIKNNIYFERRGVQ